MNFSKRDPLKSISSFPLVRAIVFVRILNVTTFVRRSKEDKNRGEIDTRYISLRIINNFSVRKCDLTRTNWRINRFKKKQKEKKRKVRKRIKNRILFFQLNETILLSRMKGQFDKNIFIPRKALDSRGVRSRLKRTRLQWIRLYSKNKWRPEAVR